MPFFPNDLSLTRHWTFVSKKERANTFNFLWFKATDNVIYNIIKSETHQPTSEEKLPTKIVTKYTKIVKQNQIFHVRSRNK